MRVLFLASLAACSYRAPADVTSSDDSAGPTPDGPAQPDAAIDSPIDTTVMPDAFDPATQCPAEYNIAIAGLTSRYRAILNQRDWATQHADCADDLTGKTHLVVYDDANELSLVGTQPTPRFLVGHFQQPNQQAVAANWFGVTGGALDASFWLANQPNDNDNSEDGDQDRAFINYNTGTGVQDGEASFSAEALCECDGQPIPPEIAALL